MSLDGIVNSFFLLPSHMNIISGVGGSGNVVLIARFFFISRAASGAP